MDLSKLEQSEKLALYAAIVVFLASLISNWGGLLLLSILAALGVAVVLFLPQMSPSSSLPGSRGSLLAGLGLVAFGAAAIELLRYIGYAMQTLGSFNTLLFLVALVGSAVMAWAGWQALQSEGGTWQFGMEKATSTPAGAADAPARPAAPEPRTSATTDATNEAQPPSDD